MRLIQTSQKFYCNSIEATKSNVKVKDEKHHSTGNTANAVDHCIQSFIESSVALEQCARIMQKPTNNMPTEASCIVLFFQRLLVIQHVSNDR